MVDIKWIGSNNYIAGNFSKVGFILHWMAGYLPGTDQLFRPGGSADYATHYGIGSPDGWGTTLEVHQYVADKDRSFGSYNADADTRGLSIEIENDRRAPYPGKPTPAVHELVAQFMAQKAIEHDMRIGGELKLVLGDFPDHRFYQESIPAFGRDFNVTTHRSMALKDCPGTTDVQWLVDRANQIINGQALPTPEETNVSEIIVAVPSGVVVHFLPNQRTDFGTAAEYDDYRGLVEFVADRGGSNLLKPPSLDKVVGISWERFESLCRHFGVPTGKPEADEWLAQDFVGMPAVDPVSLEAAIAKAVASVAVEANLTEADVARIAAATGDELAKRVAN